VFTFSISDHYHSAMNVMGYSLTGKPNLKYRKGEEDIFSNFRAMFAPQCVQFYGNRNVTRRPGIVALYTGYQTLTYSRGKFIKVHLSDGSEDMEGVIWPAYGTADSFDPALVNALRTYKKKVCLVMAKIGKNNRGFNSLTIQEMRLIG
jgi:hypothetical protein